MNRINFLCTADWHLDSKEYNVIKAELSLKEIAEYV
jgi:DNA repair exonuclease SbcCD nuclease subunit